ncbi:putative cytosolic protein [Borrelia duttonii CR2A]|nr:putative cytosolic protein [Borrelia duttonii CR2A]
MIIRDVISKLDENCMAFEEFIDTSISSIQVINDLKSDNSSYVDISKSVESCSIILLNLLRRIDDVEKNNSNFLNLYYEQIKLVKSLELMFSNISAISSRFQNINIASKIEVVKRIELEDMEGNISEMSKIINNIDLNITKGREFLSQIIFFFEKVVKDCDNRFYIEKNYFNKFKKLFIEIKSNIFEIKRLAIDHVLSYEMFPVNFLEIFEEVKLDIHSIKALREDLINIEKILIDIENDINSNLDSELLKHDLKCIEVEDKEFIRRIANRFTLFVHKKYLLSLIEDEKDVHSFDEGSVILF